MLWNLNLPGGRHDTSTTNTNEVRCVYKYNTGNSFKLSDFTFSKNTPPQKKTQQNTPIYLSIAGKEMMQFLFAFART